MVDFVRLQHIVKEQLDLDRTIRTVEAEGPTIEDAVNQAATLLDLPVRWIEYELIERGSGGFLGSGKKDWKIRAYEQTSRRKNKDKAGALEEDASRTSPFAENKPGEIFVRLINEGAFLKVTPPKGKGARATEAQAKLMLEARNVKDMDDDLIA
ncbi:MAG: Jag N-terminal domain-containing protein, partial [Treponema sp.]|nr:Jag N-terminal domain-containing protein [Treponema sp.]